MKTQQAKVFLSLCFLFICLFSVGAEVTVGNGDTDEKKHIPLQGEWTEGIRSVETECPVSVYCDGLYLYVESASFRSEICVTISGDRGIVYWKTIPAGSCPATLYVGPLDSGQAYRLVLTNQFGDRLEGVID